MITLLLIIIPLTIGVLYHVNQCYRMRNLPPYFEGAWPIVGHSVMLLTAKNILYKWQHPQYSSEYRYIIYFIFADWHSLMQKYAKEFMDQRIESITMRIGIWNFHGICNPDDAFHVANSCLKKDTTIYSYLAPILGEGLITAEATIWKIHRKLLNPALNQQVLDGFLDEFNYQSRKLIDSLAVQAGKQPFDQFKPLTQSILETVCATSMGIRIEERHLKEMLMTAVQEYLFGITERISKFWLHSDLIFLLTGHKKHHDKITNTLNTLTMHILNQKKNEYQMHARDCIIDNKPEKRYKPFIEILMELSENGKLGDKEIADELNTFIVAGSDTISIALSNALTCIGSYGAVQDRIVQELKEVFGESDRDVVKHDLTKLKYLEAVIKESMRLYPSVTLIGRLLEEPLKIKGYTLPAGSKVYIFLYAILRHRTWGPDADTFRPERWLDGSLPTNLKAWAAFGLGKRSCIGSSFALMCMKTFLAGFLRRYSIKSDISKLVQEFNIATKPICGHEISITNRY